MGRKSVKTDKNIYQTSREEASLSRESASEKLVFISADRIEKIENHNVIPHPDEVLKMAEVYKKPMLCNHYCTHECEIGQAFVPEIKLKDVSQITLEMLANLNRMLKDRDRLVEITVDGAITDDEIKDFNQILQTLENMSITIDSLKMWVENEIIKGKLKRSELNI